MPDSAKSTTKIESTIKPVESVKPVESKIVEPVKLVVNESQFEQIEKVMRDGGMDTMSVIKSMQLVRDILS